MPLQFFNSANQWMVRVLSACECIEINAEHFVSRNARLSCIPGLRSCKIAGPDRRIRCHATPDTASLFQQIDLWIMTRLVSCCRMAAPVNFLWEGQERTFFIMYIVLILFTFPDLAPLDDAAGSQQPISEAAFHSCPHLQWKFDLIVLHNDSPCMLMGVLARVTSSIANHCTGSRPFNVMESCAGAGGGGGGALANIA